MAPNHARPAKRLVGSLVATAVVVTAMLAGAGPASAGGPLTGSITLVDKGWTCTGPVALTSVSVTMTKNLVAPLRGQGNVDAVHIHSGCTGSIGKLTVVQYQGDGVKVGQGAHDLVIESGSVSCFQHAAGKHQDGVQVMGGRNIVFRNFTVQCQSSNNAAFFINKGTTSSEVPTNVLCDGCFLSGGGITVRIYDSVSSGVRNSTIVAGHLAPLHINKGSAVDPINVNNSVVAAGSTPSSTPPVAPAEPPTRRDAHPGPPPEGSDAAAATLLRRRRRRVAPPPGRCAGEADGGHCGTGRCAGPAAAEERRRDHEQRHRPPIDHLERDSVVDDSRNAQGGCPQPPPRPDIPGAHRGNRLGRHDNLSHAARPASVTGRAPSQSSALRLAPPRCSDRLQLSVGLIASPCRGPSAKTSSPPGALLV